jgi:hypothetical protein
VDVLEQLSHHVAACVCDLQRLPAELLLLSSAISRVDTSSTSQLLLQQCDVAIDLRPVDAILRRDELRLDLPDKAGGG